MMVYFKSGCLLDSFHFINWPIPVDFQVLHPVQVSVQVHLVNQAAIKAAAHNRPLYSFHHKSSSQTNHNPVTVTKGNVLTPARIAATTALRTAPLAAARSGDLGFTRINRVSLLHQFR